MGFYISIIVSTMTLTGTKLCKKTANKDHNTAILVRKYLVNPILRTSEPFFFRESLCVTYVLCIKTRRRDGARVIGCEYKMDNGKEVNNMNIEMTIRT